ncbi:hypothetical protein YC2023_009748 [Brassica napus]
MPLTVTVIVTADVKISETNLQKLLPGSLTCVKRLSLCVISPQRQVPQKPTEIFHQLLHLSLCTCYRDWRSYLTWMIEASPKLQTLKLQLFQHHVETTFISSQQIREKKIRNDIHIIHTIRNDIHIITTNKRGKKIRNDIHIIHTIRNDIHIITKNKREKKSETTFISFIQSETTFISSAITRTSSITHNEKKATSLRTDELQQTPIISSANLTNIKLTCNLTITTIGPQRRNTYRLDWKRRRSLDERIDQFRVSERSGFAVEREITGQAFAVEKFRRREVSPSPSRENRVKEKTDLETATQLCPTRLPHSIACCQMEHTYSDKKKDAQGFSRYSLEIRILHVMFPSTELLKNSLSLFTNLTLLEQAGQALGPSSSSVRFHELLFPIYLMAGNHRICQLLIIYHGNISLFTKILYPTSAGLYILPSYLPSYIQSTGSRMHVLPNS